MRLKIQRRRRITSLVGVAAIAVIIAGGQCAPAALATPASPPVARVLSYQPLLTARHADRLDTAFSNVDYNGGPVMPSNTDYLLFWSPGGYGAYGSGNPPEYVSGIEQYFQDLSHDSGGHENVDSVSAQYGDLTGAFANYAVTYGGAFLDTDPYPTSQCPVSGSVTECLTDGQIESELESVVSADHLGGGLTHEVSLLTPPTVASCFTNDPTSNPPYGGCSAGEQPSNLEVFCAYHSQTDLSPMLVYSVDGYVTGNQGCDDGNHPNGPSDGAIEGGLSHEHNESITDPIPNDAWTNGAGNNHGDEVADQCEGQFGVPLGSAPDGATYNQVINGHFYWYQEEWSNQGHACMQRYTPSGGAPKATFAATSAGGLAMNFDATGSSASGGVSDYSWQFNDSNGGPTVEQKTPTIAHTFPAAGAYSLGLTVFGPDGVSAGAGGIVTPGQNGFTPGFTFTPASPVPSQQVSFTGLSNVSAQQVTNDLWDFGDGSTGSGANPTHAYAAPGTYKVKVVLFSGVGSAFPGSGAAPVYQATVVVANAVPALKVSAPAHGKVGSAIASSAISGVLSNGVSPAGKITFTRFGPRSTAPTSCTTSAVAAGTASVSGNGSYHPTPFTPLHPGDYWWYAAYGGSSNNDPAASTCGSAMPKTVVARASSSVTSVIDDAATRKPWSGRETAGASAYDTAKVTGAGPPPTGAVTYSLFANGTCSGHASHTQPVRLQSKGTVPNSKATGGLSAGTYAFRAVYSGDSGHNPSRGSCESFKVARHH